MKVSYLTAEPVNMCSHQCYLWTLEFKHALTWAKWKSI